MLAAGGMLVVLAIPALQIHTAVSGFADMPRSLEVKTYDRIQAAFPGGPIPANAVLEANDVRSPRVASAIADLRLQAFRHPELRAGPSAWM
jgi:hypothetical protein